jgi:glycosyltransferase involved in cell wall biosynthesis
MYYRIPVLAYNAGAIKDTMGGAGILVNTKAPETVAKICEVVFSNVHIGEEIVAKQTLNLKRFSKAEVTLKLSALLEKWKNPAERINSKTASRVNDLKSLRILYDVTVLHEWLRSGYNTGIARVASNILCNMKKYGQVIPIKLEKDGGECCCRIIDMDTYTESDMRIKPVRDDVYFMPEFQLPGIQIPEDHPAPSLLRDMGVKCYAIIYDILPLQMPQYFENATVGVFDIYLRRLVENYDGILTDSRAVADEVAVYCDEHGIASRHPVHINWFHPGVEDLADLHGNVPEDVREFFDTNENIFLMVGTVEPRKNHQMVLEVFENRWKRNENDRLCIVGRSGWNTEKFIQRLKHHQEYGKHLAFFEGADDSALCYMYRHSSALIQASVGEGFGLPLIEAGAFSLPLLCSDISVFHEVAGEFALYFDQNSGADLNKTIDEFINRLSRKELPDSGQIKRVTWDESAERVYRIITNDLAPYKTISTGNKKLLIVHPNNFLVGGQGENNRVINITRLFKEIGFDIDLFSYEYLNSEKLQYQNFSHDNREGLIKNLYQYDCRTNSNKEHTSIKEKIKAILFSKSKKSDVLADWAFLGAKELFDKALVENQYDVIVIFYTYMANLMRNLPINTKKVYFMEDSVFLQQYSLHKEKSPDLTIGSLLDDELRRLEFFDDFFCISYDEKIFYEKVTQRSMYFLPHLLPDIKRTSKPIAERKWDILYIGYNNTFNVEGLKWFFNQVYPTLKSDMRLVIIGSAAQQLSIDYDNVEVIPYATDLDKVFEDAKVSICPMFSGTGMKVKVVESMARGLPVVCNERGVDGFPDKNECGCLVTQDAGQFAQYLNRLMGDQGFYTQTLEKANRYYDNYFNTEHYSDLLKRTLL